MKKMTTRCTNNTRHLSMDKKRRGTYKKDAYPFMRGKKSSGKM